MLFVEANDAVADFWAHCDSDLHVLVLGLEDSDTLVDDGALFEQGTLLACGVLGEFRCTFSMHEGLPVSGAVGETAECAGEGLDRLILCKCDSCHNGCFF